MDGDTQTRFVAAVGVRPQRLAARASTVLPAAAPAAVELEHRASPRCGPARLDGAVDEVQQSRLVPALDTRGHAGGHPQRSFPLQQGDLEAIP